MKLSLSLKLLGLAFATFVGYYVWYVHFDYRFEEISTNKVYKSALIPPNEIGHYLQKNNIKTVIHLLDAGTQDSLNPATQTEVDAEEKAIAQYNRDNNKSVNHINIPSRQVPSEAKLERFLAVLDDPDAYPVLIHCYHGTGRAQLYSAVYRMEYENWSNQDARDKTRVVLAALGYKSSFALGKGKGDFLENYIKRDEKEARLVKNNLAVEIGQTDADFNEE
jgi:predicted protein tyrosine phosphatase